LDAKKELIHNKQLEADAVKGNLSEFRQKQIRDMEEEQMIKKLKTEKIRI
jgi:hypothetical protein